MDLSDEVYSELDFQQEENGNPASAPRLNEVDDEDDYIEDEFEESKDANAMANATAAAKNRTDSQP
jgi:hypothetical protein